MNSLLHTKMKNGKLAQCKYQWQISHFHLDYTARWTKFRTIFFFGKKEKNQIISNWFFIRCILLFNLQNPMMFCGMCAANSILFYFLAQILILHDFFSFFFICNVCVCVSMMDASIYSMWMNVCFDCGRGFNDFIRNQFRFVAFHLVFSSIKITIFCCWIYFDCTKMENAPTIFPLKNVIFRCIPFILLNK